ncbi:glycosyltransferase [Cyclobacterium salsum]|uniref:glycosyltransferase n=1 Tax=Cyclobacterium salsum TaxID=2666329 RepID=UPI003743F149
MVSIITPTHNSLEFLESTITSILSQTYGDRELLITDGAWEYLQETKKELTVLKFFN